MLGVAHVRFFLFSLPFMSFPTAVSVSINSHVFWQSALGRNTLPLSARYCKLHALWFTVPSVNMNLTESQ